MKLEIETRQLQRSWREFHECLRSQQQQHQQQDQQQQNQNPRQPDDLASEIAEEIQYWSSHRQRALFRKAIKWAQKCLDTMDAHAVLMQMLPDSKYFDLFFGVVYSIVKAAKEQHRVAEAFLKLLARINHAVASAVAIDCSTDLAIALYSQIFLFLGEFLRDYVNKARCRLLFSHNEDFKSNFKNLVTSVENLAVMRLESVRTDGSYYTLVGSSTPYFDKIGLEGEAREYALRTMKLTQLISNTQQRKIVNYKLTANQASIMEEFLASLQAQVHQMDVDEDCHLSGNSIYPQTCPPAAPTGTTKRRHLKDMVQQQSSSLQDFFDNNEQIYPFGPDQSLEIPAPVATALFDWTQTNPSLPLAMLGADGRFTLVSACYIFVARKHNIPVMSHFCASSPRTSKEAGLAALVYSLIRQLIDISPPMLDCDSNCDLSRERFERFNGTLDSLTDALALLDSLLHYRPPMMFCVIDSLDLLGDEDHNFDRPEGPTEPHIKSLVSLLASHTTPKPPTTTTNPNTTSTSTTTTTDSTTTTTTTITPQQNPSSSPSSSSSSSSSSSASSPSSSPGLFKVLFTTTGPCRAIQSCLVDKELGQVMTVDTTPPGRDEGDTVMADG